MCGIFGMFLNRPLTPKDIRRGQTATDRLAHRGPDGGGYWHDVEAGVFLGHRRLAIIDPTPSSDQPMLLDNGIITYNGELYNFIEVRDALIQAGRSFKTDGDTEVLLAAWQTWGVEAFHRLDGMFAFAIWNGGALTLAVDPFAEKPLYWLRRPEGIYFASEVEPLREIGGLVFEPTPQEVALFVMLGYIPAPQTGYAGLQMLPPATVMTFRPGQAPQAECYWTPPLATERGSGPALPLSDAELDGIQEILVTSIRRRLRSDVPLGLFLSGGIDSSLVAAIASRDCGQTPTALTVSFPDGVDEVAAARAIAEHLGLPHVAVDSHADESWRQAPAELQSLYGVPNDNFTAWSIRLMSSLARRHMTVALSGLGGDEVFFGYNKYTFLWRRRGAFALPGWLTWPAAALSHLPGAPAMLKLAAEYLQGNNFQRFLAVKNGGLNAAIVDEDLSVLGSEFGFGDGRPLYLQARDFDMRYGLTNSYNPAVDRGSMRSSLEVRTPFLSRSLVEAVAKLDARALIAFGQKSVLRRLLERYLPPALCAGPKRGFVFPMHRYLDAQPQSAPRILGIGKQYAEAIWRERGAAPQSAIALRLDLLRHMMAKAASDQIGLPLRS